MEIILVNVSCVLRADSVDCQVSISYQILVVFCSFYDIQKSGSGLSCPIDVERKRGVLIMFCVE